jgi:hypothetical protein
MAGKHKTTKGVWRQQRYVSEHGRRKVLQECGGAVYVSMAEGRSGLQGGGGEVYEHMEDALTRRSGGQWYVTADRIATRRCRGNGICEHGRQKRLYKECGGAVYVSM